MDDDLCTAVANGDYELVTKLLSEGVSSNQASREGYHPLCIAAFWGHVDIAKLLLKHRANINCANVSTGMTPCHCAALQGHGRVLMTLLEHTPNLTAKDSQGRTAADFGSANDAIWPLFADAGCRRTSKQDLIRLDVVKKVAPKSDVNTTGDNMYKVMQQWMAHFSRPGSAYVINTGTTAAPNFDNKATAASLYGDVLSEDRTSSDSSKNNPSFSAWRT
ncbi:ankyrin repeat domain-containing protein 39-like isoform X2 [Dysidea avara]|uniref:ankyrin repeat domain-containing protein 39-like isoform X2 n=1 Tax=Dysidea avara TaxID=196820 RepID=UPI003319B037